MRKSMPWIFVAIGFVVAAVAYPHLPERVPIHWNARGTVDGWGSPLIAAFTTPVVMAVMALLLPALPKIDPRRANYEKFQPTYDLAIATVIASMLLIELGMIGTALGWPISVPRFGPIVIGGLFIVLGNVLPRTRPNWWFGIRTPWTLSNDRVWERTHRLGGYTFVIAGVLLLATGAAPVSFFMPVFITAIAIAALIPLVYSFIVWKQETPR